MFSSHPLDAIFQHLIMCLAQKLQASYLYEEDVSTSTLASISPQPFLLKFSASGWYFYGCNLKVNNLYIELYTRS